MEMEMVNFPSQGVLAFCLMEILQFVRATHVAYPSLIPRGNFVRHVGAGQLPRPFSSSLILMTISWLPMPTPPQTKSWYSRRKEVQSRIFPFIVIMVQLVSAWILRGGSSPHLTPASSLSFDFLCWCSIGCCHRKNSFLLFFFFPSFSCPSLPFLQREQMGGRKWEHLIALLQ